MKAAEPPPEGGGVVARRLHSPVAVLLGVALVAGVGELFRRLRAESCPAPPPPTAG